MVVMFIFVSKADPNDNDDDNYLRLGGHNALKPPEGYEIILS